MSPPLELVECPGQLCRLDGLEQVVNAVHGKGVERILVVSGSKHDGGGDFYLLEKGEGRTVAQVNVHEDKVWSRVAAQPLDGLLNALQDLQDFNLAVCLLQHGDKVLAGCRFVFYNQYSHAILMAI